MIARTIKTDDGALIHYRLAGPDAGVPILLCHGLGAGSAQFAADIDHFASRGYRVIAPDLRGHGASGLPDRVTADAFSTARLRADIYAVLDQEGIGSVHWVGNSLGGILGLGIAAEQPARLASLAIFGTALALDVPAAGWMFRAFDRFPGRPAMAWLTAQTTTANRAARPIIADLLRRYDGRAAGHIVDHIRHYDLVAAAQGWTGPGLVLVGGRDHAVNKALKGQIGALAAHANWQTATLPQGGHCANLDASDDWRHALLSFWPTA